MGDMIPAQPWSANPKFWDTIELNGKQVPGLAAVDCERGNKWDTKQAKGKHGGKREFNGADLAKVKITIRLITGDEHDEFVKDHLPGIEPSPGKKAADVVTIGHAVTYARNVPSITIDKVDGPKIQNGIAVYIIDGTEQRPLEKKNATGAAGGGTVGGTCAQLLAQYHKAQEDLASAMGDQRRYLSQYSAYKSQREAAGLHVLGSSLEPSLDENEAARNASIATANLATAQVAMTNAVAAMTAKGCPKAPSTSPAATGGGTWYSAELKSAKGAAAGGTVR